MEYFDMFQQFFITVMCTLFTRQNTRQNHLQDKSNGSNISLFLNLDTLILSYFGFVLLVSCGFVLLVLRYKIIHNSKYKKLDSYRDSKTVVFIEGILAMILAKLAEIYPNLKV